MDSYPSGGDPRRIWSCVACRRRKVKCDRRAPACDACARTGVECHYPVTGRLPSRGRAPPQWSSPHQKQTDLLHRLRRLEAVVTELSAQVDEVNGSSAATAQHSGQLHPTASETVASGTGPEDEEEEGEGETSEDFGRLVTGGHGRVRIARSFWSVFCDEVDHIFQSIQDTSEEAAQADASNTTAPSPCVCHVFGLGGTVTLQSRNDMKASPTQVSFLLQSYKERVDPFVKVLATDTLRQLCDSWRAPPSDLDPAQAALRSSVLFGAVVALSPAETQAAFEQPKRSLLAGMRAYAEQDLARAKYLATGDLTVLQALIVYTSMLPYAGMQDVAGPMAASTVQIAMQNGLHIEGERTRLGDADIRHAMWSQVCFLSSRFQVADAAVSRWPPNTVDTMACIQRLYPGRRDHTLIFIVRCTIWNLSRQMRHVDRTTDAAEADFLVSTAKSAIEDLLHQQQLHNSKVELVEFVRTMSRLFFAKIEHASLAQKWQRRDKAQPFAQSPQSQDTAQDLSDGSMTMLEAIHALNTRPGWAPWRWQLQGLFPWAAMRLVFAHFGGCRWTPQSERAWVLARGVVGGASEEVRMDAAWPSLGGLMGAARAHRQEEMQRIMADAVASADYMRIIEAGQQVFYSEGLASGGELRHEPVDSDKMKTSYEDAREMISQSPPLQEPGWSYGWSDELAAMDGMAW
ncbi:fungal specific transcription factor domain-containing protein [Cordyceps javanica]|uniref:Fungal specific transcription factor domain-containing protein n=1 Tax=Cordyceps javanica TaxID=43265 RepID=A0A545VHL9_9HYPO|nr:fungal specific transcription factor domain-containing protein [Cordyceps javanica]TQW12380.1 fungal specific transcription factor domain-containing protein [Cordyceps javanica]